MKMSPLEMSDEDFLKHQHEIPEEPEQEEDGNTDDPSGDVDADLEIQEEGDIKDESSEDETTDSDESETNEETSNVEDPETPVISKLTEQEQLSSIYKPFKANGNEMQVNNPDDVIRLMQMGANYNKKMQDLAPKMKAVATLESNDLLDADKLNQLIGLSKKSPEAIAAFLKEADIDPLDLDMEKADDFQQENYGVTDQQMALDSAIEDIKSTETYQKTVDTVSAWDNPSQDEVVKDPNILRIIDGHMGSGIYDQVTQIVNSEKALGKLPSNMSFIDAYRTVGMRLEKAGAFNIQATPSNNSNQESTNSVDSGNNKEQPVNSNKRAAAAQSKSTTTKTSKKNSTVSPLELSDEDFIKQYGNEEWAIGG